MAVQITPRNMVVRALTRRKISNTPTVLPAAPSSQPSPDQLYNFNDVGGLAQPNPQTPTQRPVSPLGQDIPGSQGSQGIPQVQAPGGIDVPPQDDTPNMASRPRVVPNQPVNDATPYPAPSGNQSSDNYSSPVEQELAALMDERSKLENTQPVDDDTKLVNFYKGSQYAVRQVQREGGDLGATLGALVGGGLRGLFTKNEDEKRELNDKLAVNQKKIDQTQKMADSELERRAKQLTIKGKEITNDTDLLKQVSEDPVWKLAMQQKVITADMASTLNKRFGQNIPVADWRAIHNQMQNGKVYSQREGDPAFTENTSIPADPTKVPVTTNSPVTGTPVTVEPNQLLTNETAIAQGNASRQQQAETTNVNNAKDIAIKNAELLKGWQENNLKLRLEQIGKLGDATAGMGDAQGAAKKMQGAYDLMSAAADRINSAGDDDAAREKAQKDFEKYQTQFAAAQAEVDKSLGKVQGGQAALQQIQSLAIPKPQLLSQPAKVSAKTVGGKVVSRDQLKAFADTKNWTTGQAEAYAKNHGWTIQ